MCCTKNLKKEINCHGLKDTILQLVWPLHTPICIKSEQQVIHRDIKASNIMLDGVFNVMLGDFGLTRLIDLDQSHVSTHTAGTMGYLALEYLQYGKETEKNDVLNNRVVILVVSCGRRPIEREDLQSGIKKATEVGALPLKVSKGMEDLYRTYRNAVKGSNQG